MNKKNSREQFKAATKQQSNCITDLPASQVVQLIDFASSLFRYHNALLETVAARLSNLGSTTCAEWQLSIANFENAEAELDKAWEVVKAQGYKSKAAAYAAYVKLCSH